MSKSSKPNKHAPHRPVPVLPAPPAGGNAKRWGVLGLVTLLAFGATWVILERFVWATTPSELVGKWVVTEGPDEGGTVDFYRNGTMIAKVNLEGKEGTIEAKIRVEDKKLHVTTRHPKTGEVGVRVQTIKVLSGNFLVLEDARGNSVKMRRADD